MKERRRGADKLPTTNMEKIYIVRGTYKGIAEITPRATNDFVMAMKMCAKIAGAHGERLKAGKTLSTPECYSIKFTIEEIKFYEKL